MERVRIGPAWTVILLVAMAGNATFWALFAERRVAAAAGGALVALVVVAVVALGPAQQGWSSAVPVAEWAALLLPSVIHASLFVTRSYDASFPFAASLAFFPVVGIVPPVARLLLGDRGDAVARPRRVAYRLHVLFACLLGLHGLAALFSVWFAYFAPFSFVEAVLHGVAADRYSRQLVVYEPRPVIRGD